MIERVLTIGAYGFDEATFVDALKAAGADLFVDIRARRGMRGSTYAFANATRLQASLSSAGIRYAHAKELAPSEEVRDAQRREDESTGTAKRDRSRLGEAFTTEYEKQCLCSFDPRAFMDQYANGSSRPVLFCVEREPEACHRSLIARRLAEALSVPIQDLRP